MEWMCLKSIYEAHKGLWTDLYSRREMVSDWVKLSDMIELNTESICQRDFEKINLICFCLLPIKCQGKHIFSEEDAIWTSRTADFRKSVELTLLLKYYLLKFLICPCVCKSVFYIIIHILFKHICFSMLVTHEVQGSKRN